MSTPYERYRERAGLDKLAEKKSEPQQLDENVEINNAAKEVKAAEKLAQKEYNRLDKEYGKKYVP